MRTYNSEPEEWWAKDGLNWDPSAFPAYEPKFVKEEGNSYFISFVDDVEAIGGLLCHGGRESSEKLVASKSTVDPGGEASKNCKCRMYFIASLLINPLSCFCLLFIKYYAIF